ncbi:hypothetical protein VTH06DRAFT_1255 [Thermothelomyces fergusii]
MQNKRPRPPDRDPASKHLHRYSKMTPEDPRDEETQKNKKTQTPLLCIMREPHAPLSIHDIPIPGIERRHDAF